MIRIISNQTLDRKRWDALVSSSDVPGMFFHFSWYLDAVFPAWQGFVYGDYEAIFPLTQKKNIGFKRMIQPIFTREFNLIGNRSKIVCRALESELNKCNFLLLGANKNSNLLCYDSKEKNFQLLPLFTDVQVIQKEYSTNLKRQLKKFTSTNIELKEIKDPQALIDLFKQEKGNEFKHLGSAEYAVILNLMKLGFENGNAHQFAAYDGTNLIASAFYFVHGNQVLYLKGAVNVHGRSIGAMASVHDFAIRFFAQNDTFFDFGGSDDPGLSEFNRKFGAHDVNYLLLFSNRLPWPLNSWAKRKYNLNA
jgi:hypothetical protein